MEKWRQHRIPRGSSTCQELLWKRCFCPNQRHSEPIWLWARRTMFCESERICRPNVNIKLFVYDTWLHGVQRWCKTGEYFPRRCDASEGASMVCSIQSRRCPRLHGAFNMNTLPSPALPSCWRCSTRLAWSLPHSVTFQGIPREPLGDFHTSHHIQGVSREHFGIFHTFHMVLHTNSSVSSILSTGVPHVIRCVSATHISLYRVSFHVNTSASSTSCTRRSMWTAQCVPLTLLI